MIDWHGLAVFLMTGAFTVFALGQALGYLPTPPKHPLKLAFWLVITLALTADFLAHGFEPIGGGS